MGEEEEEEEEKSFYCICLKLQNITDKLDLCDFLFEQHNHYDLGWFPYVNKTFRDQIVCSRGSRIFITLVQLFNFFFQWGVCVGLAQRMHTSYTVLI